MEQKKKHPGGRPESITPAQCDAYLQAISDGLSTNDAAELGEHDHGVWEKYSKRHPEFRRKVTRARLDWKRMRIQGLIRVGDSVDPRVASAVVRANTAALAAVDARWRPNQRVDMHHSGSMTVQLVTAPSAEAVEAEADQE